MQVKTFYPSGFGSNCYVVLSESMEDAVVVDPSVSYAKVVSSLGFSPRFSAILLTHAHADHLLALSDWRQATGAPVMIFAQEAFALNSPEANCSPFLGLGDLTFGDADRLLRNMDEIPFGEEALTVLHTPGHTVGSVCYYAEGHLLSGDTLFAHGGLGRTDLFGGSEDVLYASVASLITLPPETAVYPGHGPASTVRTESLFHSYLL